jgi:hypothetical protein
MPSFEQLLPLGALMFYVYDCGMLLYDNELLFLRSARRWRVEPGSRHLLLRRRVCLPGFLQPWLAIYRLNWSDVKLPRGRDAAVGGDIGLDGLLPLQLLCAGMLFLLLPVLPLVSLGYGAGWVLLAVFALYYLLIVVALTLIWWRRRQWSLGPRAFASVALDSLACAPFAANLVRRVTLRQQCPADGVVLASAVCQLSVRRQLLTVLAERLSERIAAAPPGGPEALQLQERRRQLEAQLS